MSALPRPSGNEARARVLLYGAVCVALLVFFGLTRGRVAGAGPAAHALIELASTLLALVVGVLATVRHYSRRERQFLFLGATFLGTAAFDGLHTLVQLPQVGGPVPDISADWSWFASRTFLSVFLFRLAIAPRPRAVPTDLRLSETALFGITFLLTAAAAVALLLLPLPALYRPIGPFGQPQEWIPGLLFVAAVVVNFARGGWRRNAFEHWLVLSLLTAVAGQLLFSATSQAPDDIGALMAHVLKLVSYACIFAGLLASVYFTYRGLEDSRRALAGANVALQNEVKEREATERELQIRTAYLERLFDHAPEAIVVLDLEDRVLRVNAEFTRLFGFEAHEAIGRTINELVVPPSILGQAGELSVAVGGGQTVSTEAVRMRKDGSLVDVSILGTPISLEDDRVAVYGIYRDITARKQAEDALVETAQRLEAIVRASPLAILTIDAHDVVRMWNPAAVRTLGWPEEEAVGRPLADLAPGRRHEVLDLVRHARAGDALPGAELEWTRRDGSTIVASLATAPLAWTREGERDLLIVLADVTQRRAAEEAMRQATEAAEAASRAKSDFLASMSHELRTPLNSVIGFTKVLIKNKAGNLRPTDLTYLERIAANGEHLLGLINNILDLSKVEAGMMDVDLMQVDPADLIRETVAQLEGRVATGEVHLAAQVPDRAGTLHTDPHRIRQVLINLIGNAVKFTPRGQVKVSLDTDPDTGEPLRIHVTDTGIGIPADRLAVIFEAFEQADRSTSRRFGGTGLGLSISRAICTRLGYDLTVTSEVGKGSTFTIHLSSDAARGASASA